MAKIYLAEKDHTHTASEVGAAPASHTHTASEVGAAPASHNHAASNITSGTLSSDRLPTVPITKGGTGATTAAAALTNLGVTATAAELNILDGVTATAAELNILDGITVTTDELNYVDGVTSNIQTQLNGKAASSHNHSAANITSGTLAVGRGGTGVTSNPSMLTNLGSTTAASVFASSPRPGVTGTLPVANGGTGATTAAAALTNLGVTATAAELNILDGVTATAAELNILDGVTASTAELNYVDGVTSNIQTQLNGKAGSSHNHAASEITSGTLPVGRGGTGITSNPSMLVNLGSTSAASVFATSPRPGVTGTLPVANGGTGATDAKTARANLGAADAKYSEIMNFYSLSNLELNDSDLSETDLKTNLRIIIEQWNSLLPLPIGVINHPFSNSGKIGKSILAQINADLGLSLDVYMDVRIIKLSAYMLRIYVYPQGSGAVSSNVFYAMYNNNDNNDYLSKFTYAVHPSGFLPLSGGMMSGYTIGMSNGMAKIQSSSSGTIQFDAYDTANDSTNRRVLLLNSNNKESNLNKALRMVTMIDGADTYYNIFGEHNKPSGSYSGNGSSTERTIEINGIGNTLLIWSLYGITLVPLNNDALTVKGGSGAVSSISKSTLTWDGTTLTIKSTNSGVNANGSSYKWIVL